MTQEIGGYQNIVSSDQVQPGDVALRFNADYSIANQGIVAATEGPEGNPLVSWPDDNAADGYSKPTPIGLSRLRVGFYRRHHDVVGNPDFESLSYGRVSRGYYLAKATVSPDCGDVVSRPVAREVYDSGRTRLETIYQMGTVTAVDGGDLSVVWDGDNEERVVNRSEIDLIRKIPTDRS